MDLNTVLKDNSLAANDIKRIYYGGDNCCRCGCKGKYADAGTSLFKRYMNKIAKSELVGEVELGNGKDWVNLPTDNSTSIGKCFCLYFKQLTDHNNFDIIDYVNQI